MSGLQGFLDNDDGDEGTPEPAADPRVDSPPQTQEPQGNEPEKDPAASPAGTQPDPDADAEAGGGPTIPRAAFIKAREDWKAKAVRAETEAAERARQLADLQRQLEEARKAPPAPAPQAQQQPRHEPPPLPDPETNPAGYVAALIARQQQEAMQAIAQQNFRYSELRLRDKIGDEAVDAVVAEFQAAAQADRTLTVGLHQADDPFGYAYKAVQRIRALREVGDDPAAFRARIEAEIREKIAAEASAAVPQQPQRPPVPRMQPSLARGRSAAPRGLGEENDDTDVPLADILRR